MRRLSGLSTALSQAREVKRTTGKPVAAQLYEIARLRLGRGKIMPDEYFAFGLYDDKLHDADAKARFIGQWAKDAIYRANDSKWRATGDDKLVAYLLLAALGEPYPKVRAIFHPTRPFPALTLRSRSAVADFLRRTEYPLFSKPVDGGAAERAYLLRGYDPDRDNLMLGDGRSLGIDDFTEACVRSRRGVIFQELIVPHPAIVDLCGPRAATMRLYVLNGPHGAVLHRAVLRLPVGTNMYDNFKGGQAGNLLAALDDDGRIIRTIGGGEGGLREVQHHPDTGAELPGFHVPDWEEAVGTCLRSAQAFPGLKVQGWDVAPTPAGPTLVEINTHGDLDLIQIAHRKGIFDDRWQAAMTGREPSSAQDSHGRVANLGDVPFGRSSKPSRRASA